MLDDPRRRLTPGSYRAMVVEKRWTGDGDCSEVVYTLPGCGDWRYAIRSYDPRVEQRFLNNAASEGWFEFVVKGQV